jgi:predicted AlkP superfamily pyrophosphatase or phosphodiesterase
MKGNKENKPLVVINIVGLVRSMLGKFTPNLNRLASDGVLTSLEPVFPAVTTTAQTTMLTGAAPSEHGVVGNGWYWRELDEVRFWLQSDRVIQRPRVWDVLKRRDPALSCSNLFWWYNMYAHVDHSMTPRPHYPADGRKIVDLYSTPVGLHQQIEAELGKFPFFNFWGPASDIRSSEWIARAAEIEFQMHRPDLQLVYLPHLDYNLQRFGPDDTRIKADVVAIDAVAGRLIDAVRAEGAEVMVVSEYGITNVDTPVHLNRVLRNHGYLGIRLSLGRELLESGASRAFAVADHQVAHVYVRDPDDVPAVAELVAAVPGVEQVLDGPGKADLAIDHPRSGDLVAIAAHNAWFTYYYWQDDGMAPDFARTVDIHRKPGYDPVELFVNPDIRFPKFKMAARVAQKLMGFRMLMDVIPLTAELVRGSHGRLPDSAGNAPVFLSSMASVASRDMAMHEVHDRILDHFGGTEP